MGIRRIVGTCTDSEAISRRLGDTAVREALVPHHFADPEPEPVTWRDAPGANSGEREIEDGAITDPVGT